MYNRRLGGAGPVFRGPMFQQGYGLEGYFKRFFKWIVPIAQTHFLPKLKSGLESVGNQAVESASNFARDTIKGKNVKESAKERFEEGVDVIKDKVEKNLSGNGKKRKPNRQIVFKKRSRDIFD